MKVYFLRSTTPLLLACLVALGACGGNSSSTTSTNDDTTTSCTPSYGDNLLKNPEFNLDSGANKLLDWQTAQHIGEQAFDLEIKNSTVTITKTSEQPWFILSQNIDVSQLLNKSIEISADLKLNLTESKAHAFKAGGGFQVLVQGKPDDPLGSELLVYESTLENEPRLGTSDWKKAVITFTLPQNSTRMKVGFLHQADGDMSIREPSLRVVTKSCP